MRRNMGKRRDHALDVEAKPHCPLARLRKVSDDANKFDVPSYTVFDAAIRYDFGKANPKLEGLKAALNVSNLFDRKYVSTCIAATGCYWGEGRTVYATLKYSW